MGILRLIPPALLLICVSCTCITPLTEKGHAPALEETFYYSFDGDRFPYQSWGDPHPNTVIIGFHGIAGASEDFKNLAVKLSGQKNRYAVYAPSLRGQGRDTLKCRRGDLRDPDEWFSDALTFTKLIRKKHPGARIVWCGESMGSLITLHALASSRESPPPCHALILSSPVVHIPSEKLSPAKRAGLRFLAAIAPKFHVSLEGLTNEQETRVTRDSIHQNQVENNPWHVSKFSLRLLSHLDSLITTMPEQASQVTVPVLILHGGNDVFSHPEDVSQFEQEFLNSPEVQRHFYPESYHLLFYDYQRETILNDVSRWLE